MLCIYMGFTMSSWGCMYPCGSARYICGPKLSTEWLAGNCKWLASSVPGRALVVVPDIPGGTLDGTDTPMFRSDWWFGSSPAADAVYSEGVSANGLLWGGLWSTGRSGVGVLSAGWLSRLLSPTGSLSGVSVSSVNPRPASLRWTLCRWYVRLSRVVALWGHSLHGHGLGSCKVDTGTSHFLHGHITLLSFLFFFFFLCISHIVMS